MQLLFNEVNYIYGIGSGYEKHALRGINLEIRSGEFIGICGHSGSGKSTLLTHMNGLTKPTSGNIFYDGMDIHDPDFNRRLLRTKIGLVFQEPEQQLFETTVIKDVQFGPKNMGLPLLDIEKRSYDACRIMGIGDDLIDASPLELSGGQRRRVAIAGVLAMQPEMLVLDEPACGLDPEGRKELMEILRVLHKDHGMTIVLVSHNMEDLASYANRMLVMKNGALVLDGAPSEIFQYENELRKIGLGIPDAAQVVQRLSQRGNDIHSKAITVEQAAEDIAAWIKR